VPLYEIDLFKTTDISDLLGSFEQTNLECNFVKSLNEVKASLNHLLKSISNVEDKEIETLFKTIMNLEYIIRNNHSITEQNNVLTTLLDKLNTLFNNNKVTDESFRKKLMT